MPSPSPKHPRDPWQRDAKAAVGRRYVITAIAAVLAAAIFLFAVDYAGRRAVRETAQAELARLQTVSLEAARQIEAFFDERFTALDNFANALLAVSSDAEAADRLAAALVEDDPAVLSASFAVGNVYGIAEWTGGGVVVSRSLFRAREEVAQWVQDAYEMSSDERDRYMERISSAVVNPGPYATTEPPKPLTATEIGISFDRGGLAWLELPLRDVEDICDGLRGAFYTAPLLLTHGGTSALQPGEDKYGASEVRMLLEAGPEQSGIMGAEYDGVRSVFAAHDVRIGATGRAWRIAFYSDYAFLTYRVRDKYEEIRTTGLFAILLIAVAAAVVVRMRAAAARPKAGSSFKERTKGLRRQRLACRLICVFFFIPALFFITGRERAFQAAVRARDEKGMKAAVAGMWPVAIVGLLLGLAALWVHFALD